MWWGDATGAKRKGGTAGNHKNPRKKKMVGTVRFELTTSSTPRKRATKLRYVPTKLLPPKPERRGE